MRRRRRRDGQPTREVPDGAVTRVERQCSAVLHLVVRHRIQTATALVDDRRDVVVL